MNDMSDRDVWEDDICNSLSARLDIPRGDAQGIVEANSFEIARSWSAGDTADAAADHLAGLRHNDRF